MSVATGLRPIEGPPVDWKADDVATTDGTSAALRESDAKSFSRAIETQEKLIEENNLRGIAFLETGIQRSRAVAFIEIPGVGLATGFMVSADRLLTNNHVFGSADEARGATIRFNYQTDLAGQMLPTDDYGTDPDAFFHTNPELDYSVVHVNGSPGDKWGFVALRDDLQLRVKEDVAIIQHPGGQPKQIAIADNEVEYVDDTVAQYLTDTLPGSSGSPVFNNDWECVALHHSGGWLPQPSDQSTHFRNEGILISAVLADLPG
jgi:V8-like Glu-specific endopeptidase